MTDREIVARVSAIATYDLGVGLAHMDEGYAMNFATDLRALCDAVERLEAEVEVAQNNERVAFDAEANALNDLHDSRLEVIRLTAENERLRGGVTPRMIIVALDESERDLREPETFYSLMADSLSRQLAAMRPTTGGTDAE